MTTIDQSPAATMTAPPCPVAWCEDSGHHQWDTLDPMEEATRFHVRHTHGEDSEHEIGAQLDETRGESMSSYVILFDLSRDGSATQELRTPAAVDAVIHALADAASLAFDPAEVADGQCGRETAWCRTHNAMGNAGACLGDRAVLRSDHEYDTAMALRAWRSADDDDPGAVWLRLSNDSQNETEGFETMLSSSEARALAGQLLRLAAQLDRKDGR